MKHSSIILPTKCVSYIMLVNFELWSLSSFYFWFHNFCKMFSIAFITFQFVGIPLPPPVMKPFWGSGYIPGQWSCTYCTFTGQWPPLDATQQSLSLEMHLDANESKRWQDQNHCFLPGHDLAYIAHFLASSRRKTRQQCCLSLGKHTWVPTGASNSNNSLLNWVC